MYLTSSSQGSRGGSLNDSSERKYAPLARDEVFWCGHPVAVVLGETEAAAEDGVHAVDVDYEPLPVVIDPLIALQPEAPLTRSRRQDEASEIAGGGAHADVGGSKQVEDDEEELSENVSKKVHQSKDDVEGALRAAAVVVERTYRTHSVHQSYLEPQSITVVPHPTLLSPLLIAVCYNAVCKVPESNPQRRNVFMGACLFIMCFLYAFARFYILTHRIASHRMCFLYVVMCTSFAMICESFCEDEQ